MKLARKERRNVQPDQPDDRHTIDCVRWLQVGMPAIFRLDTTSSLSGNEPVVVSTGLVAAGVSINSFINHNDVRLMESS
jgi:hypothetical protein